MIYNLKNILRNFLLAKEMCHVIDLKIIKLNLGNYIK